MKILINTCFGGFCFSDEAVALYCQKRYQRSPVFYGRKNGNMVRLTHVEVKNDHLIYAFTEDNGPVLPANADWDEMGYINPRPSDRTDPLWVEVAQELGTGANSSSSDIVIVDVPDDVKWFISDYDGSEHVAESHRTWC